LNQDRLLEHARGRIAELRVKVEARPSEIGGVTLSAGGKEATCFTAASVNRELVALFGAPSAASKVVAEIFRLLEERDLTVAWLARKTGCEDSYFRKLKRGEKGSKITAEVLAKIARAFSLSPQQAGELLYLAIQEVAE
jgi:DNA-binding Xre family transcriptional regulator